jgi:hypothetical protein
MLCVLRLLLVGMYKGKNLNQFFDAHPSTSANITGGMIDLPSSIVLSPCTCCRLYVTIFAVHLVHRSLWQSNHSNPRNQLHTPLSGLIPPHNLAVAVRLLLLALAGEREAAAEGS